jgi:hypothetical protein
MAVIVAPLCAQASVQSADDLWNWVLSRQGLTALAEERLTSVRAAAEASLGLHAARVASPFHTAAARTSECTPLDDLLGDEGDAELVTIRCMRKTLHTLPICIAAYAHGATRHYRLRDVSNMARRFRVTPAELEDAGVRITTYLRDQGRQSHRAIERELTAADGQPWLVRLGLKMLWEQGEVTYRNCARSWHQEKRRFCLRSVTHPRFDTALGRDVAIASLVKTYFHVYGPATVRDMAWWSGLGLRTIADALSELNVVQFLLPWAPSPFFMLQTDYERFLSAPHHSRRSGFHFLAHEDVALKAYFESRSRYLGALNTSTVFNQIGEVRPSIIYDGRIVGTWSWHHESRRIHYRTLNGLMTRASRSEVVHRAKILQLRLRRGYLA